MALVLTLLVVLLAVPVAALVQIETTPMYYVEGINVYERPYDASRQFAVTEAIYLTNSYSDSQLNINGDLRLHVATSMIELLSFASQKPFAAIVIDANAAEIYDESMIVQLAQKQHIVLLKGFTDTTDTDIKAYNSLKTDISTKDINAQGFSAYYVVANTGNICLWDKMWKDNISVEDLLTFANEVKDGIFYIYDSLVIQNNPKLKAAIDEKTVPLENIVNLSTENTIENEISASANWDPTANNYTRIFNPLTFTDVSTIVVRDAINGNTLMTCSRGEALLFTEERTLSGNYYWYRVRGWKTTSSGSTFVSGWVKSFGSANYAVQHECQSLRENAAYAYNAGSNYVVNGGSRGFGYELTAAAKLYDSSGTLLQTLPTGATVYFTANDGYAGSTRPYLISINGYMVSGTYTSASTTRFVDLNFDAGSVGSYRINTRYNLLQ